MKKKINILTIPPVDSVFIERVIDFKKLHLLPINKGGFAKRNALITGKLYKNVFTK